MLKIAENYQDKLQIAFKPHPILKNKLYKHSLWGKEATDSYYNSWQNLDNGQLEEGDYVSLFLYSDAIILDSISFLSEYTYTGKPILFTVRDRTIEGKFNEYGRILYKILYKSYSNENTTEFIENVVISGVDPQFYARKDFLNMYLIPPGGKNATENILNYLIEELR